MQRLIMLGTRFRILFFACVFFSIMNTAYAAVVNSIVNFSPSDRIIRGEFRQTQYLLNVNKPFESTGNFIFWRNKALLWRTFQPIRTTTIYDNQKLSAYLFINGQRIEHQSGATNSLINRILWSISSANLEVLSLDFQILSQSDSTGWELTLFPDSSVTNLIAKRIFVRGNSFVEEITVEYFSGDITVLDLYNVSFDSTTSSLEEAELDNP